MAIARFFQLFAKEPEYIIADKVMKLLVQDCKTIKCEDDEEPYIHHYQEKRDALAIYLKQFKLGNAYLAAKEVDQNQLVKLIAASILKNDSSYRQQSKEYKGILREWTIQFYSIYIPEVLFTEAALNTNTYNIASKLTTLFHLTKILLDQNQRTLFHSLPRDLQTLLRDHLFLSAFYSAHTPAPIESSDSTRARSHTF